MDTAIFQANKKRRSKSVEMDQSKIEHAPLKQYDESIVEVATLPAINTVAEGTQEDGRKARVTFKEDLSVQEEPHTPHYHSPPPEKRGKDDKDDDDEVDLS
jgi:hypothetical protein